MTDSPAFQTPLDPKEQPILDRILTIRDQLSLLKQDKSTYIKSYDVLEIYDHLIEEVHQLNVIREEHGKPSEQNRGAMATTSNDTAESPTDRIYFNSGQCPRRLFSTGIPFLLDRWAQQ